MASACRPSRAKACVGRPSETVWLQGLVAGAQAGPIVEAFDQCVVGKVRPVKLLARCSRRG
jgi:hypothetical protein